MAVLVISELPGVTAEQDQALMEALNIAAEPPEGARFRVAGPTETGWRVVALWDSREAFDAFLRDRIAPALESAGREAPAFEFWPIESVVIR
jgi:hypothetical protein